MMQKREHFDTPLVRRPALRVGFVPLTDCAPIAMAQHLGLFSRHGLDVTLHREIGWAAIRDKIISGELHAAHAVAGMPFAATIAEFERDRAALAGSDHAESAVPPTP